MFAAAVLAEEAPDLSVLVLEKASKPLAKVRVSGGGRCNLTHTCSDIREFIKNYPRGGRELIGPFNRFGPAETVEWFESHGVPLVTLDDAELFDGARPFGLETLRAICTALKQCAISAHWQTARERAAAGTAPGGPPAALRVALLRLTQQLYDRDARRPFMGGAQAWFAEPARQQMVESLAQRMDPDLLDLVAAEGLDGAAEGSSTGSG